MDPSQFPSNSRHPVTPSPARQEKQEKIVERVVQGDVIRRKKLLGRRLTENLIGGDVRSVWEWVRVDVVVPAFQALFIDAVHGASERMIYGENSGRGYNRSRDIARTAHVAYNRYASDPRNRREEPRREISPRSRANHQFDEILIDTRVDAMEVLDRLHEMIAKYESVSVGELYEMLGISSNFTDQKWGWTDLRSAGITRVRGKYLLDLPRPEPID